MCEPCIHVCMYGVCLCMYGMQLHTYIYACIYTYIRVQAHTQFLCGEIHAYIHIHTHTYTYTYIHRDQRCCMRRYSCIHIHVKLIAFELAAKSSRRRENPVQPRLCNAKTQFSNGSKRGFPFGRDLRRPTQTQSALKLYYRAVRFCMYAIKDVACGVIYAYIYT